MAQPSMASNPALKETFSQLRTRMEKAVEDFRKELAAVRTGRASVHMLDSVQADYYGTSMPLIILLTPKKLSLAGSATGTPSTMRA